MVIRVLAGQESFYIKVVVSTSKIGREHKNALLEQTIWKETL